MLKMTYCIGKITKKWFLLDIHYWLSEIENCWLLITLLFSNFNKQEWDRKVKKEQNYPPSVNILTNSTEPVNKLQR